MLTVLLRVRSYLSLQIHVDQVFSLLFEISALIIHINIMNGVYFYLRQKGKRKANSNVAVCSQPKSISKTPIKPLYKRKTSFNLSHTITHLLNFLALDLSILRRSFNVDLLIEKLSLVHAIAWGLNILPCECDTLVTASRSNLGPGEGDNGSEEHAQKVSDHTSCNTKNNWDKDRKQDTTNDMEDTVSLIAVSMVTVVVREAMVWLSVMWGSTVMRWWGSMMLVHCASTIVVAVWPVVHVGWWRTVDCMVRTSTHHALTLVASMSLHSLESALEAVELGGNNGAPLAQQWPLVAFLWRSMMSVWSMWSVHGSINFKEHQLSLDILESVDCDFWDVNGLALESAELDADAQNLFARLNSVGSAGLEGPACQAKRIGGVLRRIGFDIDKRSGCGNLGDIWSWRFGLEAQDRRVELDAVEF